MSSSLIQHDNSKLIVRKISFYCMIIIAKKLTALIGFITLCNKIEMKELDCYKKKMPGYIRGLAGLRSLSMILFNISVSQLTIRFQNEKVVEKKISSRDQKMK